MSSGATPGDGGRPRAAAVDRRVAVASAIAAACGLGVLVCGLLPWYGVESPVRVGSTVAVTESLWGDDRGDLALVLMLTAGVGLAALTAAIRMTARVTPAAWWVSLGAAAAFAIALLIVIERFVDPPGSASTRWGAVLALVLAVAAAAAAALAARAGRTRP